MRRLLFLFLFLFWMPMVALAQGEAQDPFKINYNDSIASLAPGDNYRFDLQIKVPSGHYLYEEKTSLLFTKMGGLKVLQTEKPYAQDHWDAFLKKNTKAYLQDVKISVLMQVPADIEIGQRSLEAELRYQGCSGDFCYRPVKKTLLIPVKIVSETSKIMPMPRAGAETQPVNTRAQPGWWQALKSWIDEANPENLLNLSRPALLLLALFGGILTSLTPCVLPIIPLTLAFIGVKKSRHGRARRVLALVLGMVLMYAVLGFLSASLGLKLGFLFQSRVFLALTALLFWVLALGLFEIIPFHLPSKLQHRLTRIGGESTYGAFLVGLTIGLVASPCVGPLIAPLLLIAARQQDRLFGFILLVHYGLGMGLLFLTLGLGFNSFAANLKSGPWTSRLKKILGVLMLLPAFYYAYSFAKPYINYHRDAMWVYDFQTGLRQARLSGKPILMDFYADWCPPCLELDRKTFSKDTVRELAAEFVMLKIDCTTDDQNCQAATSAYQVIGWPTVLFLDSEGKPFESIQLVGGFADEEKMLLLMRQALEKSKK